jgi:selenocysteine lyase/cysteine desulfurase
MCLTAWLLERLRGLRHANGRPALRLYGPPHSDGRGATIALNMIDPDDQLRDCDEVERRAGERGISLRAGCHCNPGAREAALAIAAPELRRCFQYAGARSLDEFMRSIAENTAGVVRVSLGPITTFGDVFRFARFVESFNF